MRNKTYHINTTHLIGAAAVALGLLFIIAFGAKVLEAYRLRNWRDRLVVEVQQLEREQADWEQEVQRRTGTAWLERELLDAGWVRDDLVQVKAVTATPPTAVTSTPETAASAVDTPVVEARNTFLNNEYWHAWRRLIRGFD